MTSKIEAQVVPCADRERRTCIQVFRDTNTVLYIPLNVVDGLEVKKAYARDFDHRYKPLEGYPVERACQLYLGYAQTIGATKEALSYLGQITNVSKQEFDMATTKKSAAALKAEAKAAAPKAKTAAPKAKTAAPKAKAPKAEGEKRESAAQMFQDLIMAGKLTDDQIFAKVQEKFGLDEKKRGYVKWYRNHLKKQGKNPPEAK